MLRYDCRDAVVTRLIRTVRVEFVQNTSEGRCDQYQIIVILCLGNLPILQVCKYFSGLIPKIGERLQTGLIQRFLINSEVGQ